MEISSYSLVFHPDVEVDYDNAYEWYSAIGFNLGERLPLKYYLNTRIY